MSLSSTGAAYFSYNDTNITYSDTTDDQSPGLDDLLEIWNVLNEDIIFECWVTAASLFLIAMIPFQITRASLNKMDATLAARDYFLTIIASPMIFSACYLISMISIESASLFSFWISLQLRTMLPAFNGWLEILEDTNANRENTGGKKKKKAEMSCCQKLGIMFGVYGIKQAGLIPILLTFLNTYINLIYPRGVPPWMEIFLDSAITFSVGLAVVALFVAWRGFKTTVPVLGGQFFTMAIALYSVSLQPLIINYAFLDIIQPIGPYTLTETTTFYAGFAAIVTNTFAAILGARSFTAYKMKEAESCSTGHHKRFKKLMKEGLTVYDIPAGGVGALEAELAKVNAAAPAVEMMPLMKPKGPVNVRSPTNVRLPGQVNANEQQAMMMQAMMMQQRKSVKKKKK